jgi:hypothetical protein
LTKLLLSTNIGNWFINIVFAKYIDKCELILMPERGSVAVSADVDESQMSNRLIDGRNAIHAVD